MRCSPATPMICAPYRRSLPPWRHAMRVVGARLDRRSRHGQRRQPGMAARDRPTLHRRRTQVGAEAKFGAPTSPAAHGCANRAGGPVEVKLARHGETDETVILVPVGRSADGKERAMHDRFEASGRRGGARTPRGAHWPLEEASRPGAAQPPDRPYPSAQPTRRRPLRHRPGGGRLSGRPAPVRDPQCRIRTTGPRFSEGAYLLRSNIADWSDQQSCGRPTSSSRRPKPRSASRRT